MSTQQKPREGLESLELHFNVDVAQLMGMSAAELDGWQINRIREDGAIDAYVPLEVVEVVDVPTDPRNTQRLIKLFDARAEEVGGTGQRDPVVIGHVPGDAFYMLDGFHRHEVQTQRRQTHLHATVEPNLTYEQVVKRRLEYAHTHPEIEFARQVEWMQSVWERTPWSETVPNVLTAFRAFQEDYAHGNTDDVGLIDSLSEEMYKNIRAWVAVQSKEWGYTPAQIRENLAKVESFDRDLMPIVYQKAGSPPAGRISLRHVEVITDTYAGEFDMQRALVDIIVVHELSVAQTEALINEVEKDNPVSADDVYESAKRIDFLRLKARTIKTKTTGSRANKRNESSGDIEPDLDATTVMAAMRKFLPRIKEKVHGGNWDSHDTENALEITLVLSEILAQLSLKSAGVVVEQADDNA